MASAHLSRNGFLDIKLTCGDRWEPYRQSASSAGDPSHVGLRLTSNWAWQRFLGRFETVVATQQLDRFINGWSLVLRLRVF